MALLRSALARRFIASVNAGIFSRVNTGLESPAQLPGNAAWYDVSDLSSMLNNAGAVPSSGDGIKLLSDKSGNSGVNVLCLNGVNGNNASFAALAAFGTGDFTVSIRMRVLTLAATQTVWGSAANGFAFKINTTGKVVSSKTGVADNTVSVNTVAVYQLVTMTYVRSGTSGIYYFDGVADNTIADAVDYTVGLTLLGQATASNFTTGNIHWARVYSTALTAPQVAADAAGTVQSNCVFNADISVVPKLATSFTESSSNAATVTINTTGATGARICGARDLYQGTAANQPIYLPHSGTNYGYLNGVSGNYFSSPDAAPNSITGDIDIRFFASKSTWVPVSIELLVEKSAAGQISYDFRLNTDGTLSLFTSSDGTAQTAGTSSVATGIAANTPYWVRVTRASATGQIIFYTSPDGSAWTQLGTTRSNTSGAIFDSTTALAIGGASGAGTNAVNGQIYRAQIYNGIAGTLAFDFNPAAYTSGTTFLDSSSNAATITINGGATVVTRSTLYFNGSAHYLKAAAFALSQPETVYFVGSQVTWVNGRAHIGGGTASVGFYQTGVTPSISGFAGSTAAINAGWALATNAIVSLVVNGASSSLRINRASAATGNLGANNANGFTLGAAFDGTIPANITASEVLVRSVADGTPVQDSIILFQGNKWRIAV